MGTGSSYWERIVSPYVQQWNFNIQRSLPGAIAIEAGYLGSRGVNLLDGDIVIYRSRLPEFLPASIPAAAAAAARDTLGGARDVAAQLPAAQGEALLNAARVAFVAGMQFAAVISVAVAIAVALFALRFLHTIPATGDEPPTEEGSAALTPGVPCKRPDGHVPHRIGRPLPESSP